MGDPFIRQYIDDVLRNIRTQVLIRLIEPYTRIEIPYVSTVWSPHSPIVAISICDLSYSKKTCFRKIQQLNIPEQDVEDLLVRLILDNKISGRIDQINHRLELSRQYVDPMLSNLALFSCVALHEAICECHH